MRTLTIALLGALTGAKVRAEDEYVFGADCDKTDATEIVVKVNYFPTEWGLYEVEGCTGVAPRLHLSAGKTYTFKQGHQSNWYHPIGFSYIAGGAHTECKAADGSVGECPELEDELQYFVAGAAVTDDESGFGLDAYEPEFFNSLDWWLERPEYYVTVTIPADACHDTVYYFCHIHAHMSAEIKIKGSTCPSADITRIKTDVLGGETEASALAIYDHIREDEQPVRDPFDIACGTSDSYEWTDKNPDCDDKHFLCGPGADDAFGTCLQAVDCQMHHDMAIDVPEGISKFTTFSRQMIAHHQNAVSMSKILQKHMTAADFPTLAQEGVDNEDEAENGYAFGTALNQQIIAVQNFQIQQMQFWLERGVKDWPNLIGTPADSEGMSPHCYGEYPLNPVCHGTGAANECPHGTECYCRAGHGMMTSRRTRKLLFGTAPGGDNCYCMGAPHLG